MFTSFNGFTYTGGESDLDIRGGGEEPNISAQVVAGGGLVHNVVFTGGTHQLFQLAHLGGCKIK
jgi:hypothetical protein